MSIAPAEALKSEPQAAPAKAASQVMAEAAFRRQAFTAAVRALHPDRADGGDPEKLRMLLEERRLGFAPRAPVSAAATPPRRAILGRDLWMTEPVGLEVFARGGRVRLDTPAGERDVWIRAGNPVQGRIRLAGAGPLHPDGGRGDVYLRLSPAPRPSDTVARVRLNRFAAVWIGA